jgi:integrase
LMPADAREQIRQLPSGKWQLRYYDCNGVRHSGGAFPWKSAARAHYRNVIEPELSGRQVVRRDVTFTDHVDRYLAAHATGRDVSTIKTLTHRLGYATATFGELTLEELEQRVPEIAAWIGTLPAGARYGIVQALRQSLEAAVRWGHMTKNPAKLAGPNPQPKAEEIHPFTQAEIDLVAGELGPKYGPVVVFASETGMRPSEWLAIEWRDIDRTAGVVLVERTCAYGVRSHTGRPRGAAAVFRFLRGRSRLWRRLLAVSTFGLGSPVIGAA